MDAIIEYDLEFGDVEPAQITWFKTEDHRWRFDSTDADHDVPIVVLASLSGSDEVFCSRIPEEIFDPVPETANGPVCTRTPTVDMAWTLVLVPLFTFDHPDILGAKATAVTDRSVGGLDARCYELAEFDMRPCFRDGLLVRVSLGSDIQVYEARSKTRAVSESDFEPPYPVVDPD